MDVADMQLKDKVGLVTGGLRGIGRGCVLEMVQAGAKVSIIDLPSSEAELQLKEIQEHLCDLADQVALIPADVTDQPAVDKAVLDVVDQFGRLDLFVSCAVYSDREPFLDADLGGFQKTLDVSMLGAFFALRSACRQMVLQGEGGSCVIVSSPHSTKAIPGAMAYNMAKAANDQMARTAAVELTDHRIRVNIMHPGWIDTPGERKFFSEEKLQESAGKIPWKRMGSIHDIGRGVVFMLSDEAEYMTGATMLIDGGMNLPWWSKRTEGEY